MLKKIRVEQLVLGMHIKEFCGSWMEHPFWRSAFVIDDPKDLMRIRNSSIQECWIDTARGLDIPADAGSRTEATPSPPSHQHPAPTRPRPTDLER